MKTYAVIMAGGGGTRFWPLSRQELPKQLLNLSGNDLMINETIDRISNIISHKDIFIVTNKTQVENMKSVTKGRILEDHILSEPSARNTSACIGYAATEIIQKYGDGIMCVFPADHYIKDELTFSSIIESAVTCAERDDKLVTIGVTPTFPSTGYGYIRFNKDESSVAKKVLEFKEKPSSLTAKEYISSGEYVWNSGIFIWKASTILKSFETFLPEIYLALQTIGAAMGTPSEYDVLVEVYPQIKRISIDYGIMEQSAQVVVIPGEFGWNDVGSWDMMSAIYKPDKNRNISIGRQINIDTSNCVSYASSKLIATLGTDNLIIVETPDAILVCDRSRAQDVKLIVDQLKDKGYTELL